MTSVHLKKFNMKQVKIFFLLCLFGLNAGAQISWSEVAPGVWKGITGKPENYDLMKAAGAQPRLDALGKMVMALLKAVVMSEPAVEFVGCISSPHTPVAGFKY